MRRLIVAFLLLSAFAKAQSYTTVTATLTDSSSQVWANAQWTTEFQKPAGNNGTFNNQGHAILANQTGVANASGVFTVSLDNNLVVSPAGSSWKFTICPNATVPQCNTISITIFGASQNVSTQINAVLTVPVVNSAPMIARAYNDTEVHGSYGALYINSISNNLKQCIQIACEGSGWQSFGVSSNNPIFTGVLTVPCIKFNFDLTNDSTLCSQPGTGHINLQLPSTSGTLALTGAPGGAAPPTNSVQYNNGGALGGDAHLKFQNPDSITGGAALSLFGDATQATLEIHNQFAVGIDLYTHSNTGFRGPAINLWRTEGTQASPTHPLAGDVLGYLSFGDAVTSQAYTGFEGFAAQNFGTVFGTSLEASYTPNGQTSPIPAWIIRADLSNMALDTGLTLSWGPSSATIGQDVGFSRTGIGKLALGNGTFGNTAGTLTANIALSGVGASTSPVCPNGTGATLTTTGCSGGGGGSAAPSGTLHSLVFDGNTPFTGFNMHGMSAGLVGGTFTVNTNTANAKGPGFWQLQNTVNSYGYMGEQNVGNVFNRIAFAQFNVYGGIASIINGRYWIGLSSGFGATLVNDTPNANIIAFRWNQATDGPNWHIYTHYVTSGLSTDINTGVAVDQIFHQFTIKQASASTGAFTFFIDGTQVGSITGADTSLPISTTPLTDFIQCDIASGNVQFYVHSMQWWSFF